MKKRAISFILAVAMIFTSLDLSVWAEETERNVEIITEATEVEEISQETGLVEENIMTTSEKVVESGSTETRSITYKLSKTTLTISGTGEISSCETEWSDNKDKITRIVINRGITSIGDGIFQEFSNLQSLTLPGGLETIGDRAFYGCSSLKSISLPSRVTEIGSQAFYGCSALSSVLIQANVTEIGSEAFADCSNLQKISMRTDTVKMGENVFKGCAAVTAGPTGSGSDYTFAWKNVIPENAFLGCENIQSVEIPNTIEAIEANAFVGCSSLSKIYVPNTVTSIANNAIDTSIEIITCEGSAAEEYAKEHGNQLTILEETFSGACGETANWELSVNDETANTYTLNISGSGAMYDYSLIEVSPWELTKDKITKIVLSKGITAIGNKAFYKFSGITSLELPEGIETIGDNAFYNCSSLAKVTIPSTVVSIGNSAFSGCACKTAGPIGGGYDFEFSWTDEIPAYAFYANGELEEVMIPDGIKKIGNSAFSYCSSLKKVIVPASVTMMGDDEAVFDGCMSKSAGPIGGGYDFEFGWTDKIPANAFRGMDSLTQLILPEGVEEIGDYAFSGSALSSIKIPGSVTYIGYDLFYNCYNEEHNIMTAGPIGGDYDYQFGWTEEFPENAFRGLEYLEKVYFPKSIAYSEGDYFDVPVTVCGTRGSGAEAYVNAHSDTDTFEAVDEFDVQFETYTEEKVEAQSRFIGIRVIEPKNLEKEGYTLKGWYTSAEIMDDTTKWDFANDVVTQDMTLYARWIPNSYEISEELKGYSLTLEGTIGVNFYMQLGEDVLADSEKGAYMNFTLERKTGNEYIKVPVNKATYDNDKECYVFKCGVPVKDMDIQIKGQIILSDGRTGSVYSCTVREYIEVIKTDEKYKDQQKLISLVEKMSDFGNFATAYFANGAIEETTEMEAVTSTVLEKYLATLPTDNSDIYYGSSLILKSDTILRHYFTKEVKVAEAGYKVGEKNGLYYIESEGIPAHELGNSKTVHVTTIDDNKEITITYNPLSYAYIALSRNGVDENLRSLMRTMYLYYQAALDYKNEIAK